MDAQAPVHADEPFATARQYLTRAVADPARRDALLAQVAAQRPADAATAMRLVHAALAGQAPTANAVDAAAVSIDARVRAGFPGLKHQAAVAGHRGASMPPLQRRRMTPPDVDRRPWRFVDRLLGRRRLRLPRRRPRRLRNILRLRHALLALLVFVPALGATAYMASVLPHGGTTPLELLILAAAFMLFAWILVGFWTALCGFGVLSWGGRYRISSDNAPAAEPAAARTAVVMPIFEEDATRAFAGMQAVCESVQQTGRLGEFDFFVLSDSVEGDTIIAEQQAWARTCSQSSGSVRLYYRRRRARVKRKSGNLADFCRRWGGAYRYMLVLDADSVMTGNTVVELVDRMEANPDAGLIQTPPLAVNRDSLLARIQQFATRVYGGMFAAGLHYWHLDNAHYWGHNAIIRIEPFMAHCALPRLPGWGALSGEIMSHDFVEAALLSRGGWGVFVAYDLGGSYEEVPPTLIEELGRDRRWCQGNIQHLRLLFSDNLAPAHRALFANGVMAYTSAAIWFVFLVLSSAEAVLEAVRVPDYFPRAGALFPQWPAWDPIWAISLFFATAVVLFLPKILGMVLVVRRSRPAEFGGTGRLVLSTLIEIVLTTLLAPIRMLIHSWFVASTIIGRRVKWNTQQRADEQVPWLRALRFHLPGMILAAVWGGVLLRYAPAFAPWLAPVLVPLLIAPLITVLTSRADAGRWLRRRRLQLIPEEVHTPEALRRVRAIAEAAGDEAGMAEAVADPAINALHVALQGRQRPLAADLAEQRAALAEQLFTDGPRALDAAQARQLLADPVQMLRLHVRVWVEQPAAWQRWLSELANDVTMG